jgi:hypothetical protein
LSSEWYVGSTDNETELTFSIELSAPSVSCDFVFNLKHKYIIPDIRTHGILGSTEHPTSADRPPFTTATRHGSFFYYLKLIWEKEIFPPLFV